jgi:hypothetical protein
MGLLCLPKTHLFFRHWIISLVLSKATICRRKLTKIAKIVIITLDQILAGANPMIFEFTATTLAL